MSVGPLIGYGTTTLTGLSGKPLAHALPATAARGNSNACHSATALKLRARDSSCFSRREWATFILSQNGDSVEKVYTQHDFPTSASPAAQRRRGNLFCRGRSYQRCLCSDRRCDYEIQIFEVRRAIRSVLRRRRNRSDAGSTATQRPNRFALRPESGMSRPRCSEHRSGLRDPGRAKTARLCLQQPQPTAANSRAVHAAQRKSRGRQPDAQPGQHCARPGQRDPHHDAIRCSPIRYSRNAPEWRNLAFGHPLARIARDQLPGPARAVSFALFPGRRAA
jgi:hypothetical protein